nr:NADH dehydrogenase subunit 2 [Anomopsocus sp. AnspLA]
MYKMIYYMVIVSMIFSISSTNWLGLWMGLEINMISFIPLIVTPKNIFSNESAVKYFLIQASSSSMFLSFILMSSFNSFSLPLFISSYFSFWVSIPMLIKLAAAPFHQWFIDIMNNISWLLCYLVSTLQKITPLVVLMYISLNYKFMVLFIIFSSLIGSIGGLNQIFLKKILAYSSVNHLGWLLASLQISKMITLMYLIFYMFMNAFIMWVFNMNNIFQINQVNNKMMFISFSLCLMSLAGLPPFIGFLPKLIVIKLLITNNMLMMSSLLILTALITLYYYLRISFTVFLLNSFSQKWINNNFYFKNNFFIISLMSVMTSSSLILLNFFLL